MGTVPGQQIVDIEPLVAQLGGQVEDDGEGRVAVDGSVAYVPVLCLLHTRLPDLRHGVEQIACLAGIVGESHFVVLRAIVGEIGGRIGSGIGKLVVLAAGLVASQAIAVEGRA